MMASYWTELHVIAWHPPSDGDDEDVLGYADAELQPHDIVVRSAVLRGEEVGPPRVLSIGGVSFVEAVRRSGFAEIERQLAEVGLVW
jgi:hypothetical protein